MKKIVIATGGFDPVHSGHIAYLKEARKLGDSLIVGVNSDEWLRRKKGKEFMPWEERFAIISALEDVERVIRFDDSDGSAKDAINQVKSLFPYDKIIFANGGDRTKTNIPEMDLEHENGQEVKLKELTVEPGKRLSMQRHKDRAEHWFVAEGTATVYTINQSTDAELLGTFNKFDHIHIKRTEWHQLCNESQEPLKIIEIQYGENCIEEDIERK